MAHITLSHRPAILDRLNELADRIRAASARRAVYNRTVAELSALSDRDLDDLGISRLNIADIAREHAGRG